LNVKRLHRVLFVGAACVAGAVGYSIYVSKGRAEVREATERIAVLIAHGDKAGLEREPLLDGRPGTHDWLLAKKPWLDRGYRIAVVRNGANGYTVFNREDVSHLGYIETSSGTLTLAFQCDDSGRPTFVVATASNLRVVRN